MTRGNCSLAADILILVGNEVLLIQRKNDPFRGMWALPGGFVDENEPVLHAAERELEEETGVRGVALRQFGAYGDPGRDPRGRTVSIVYWVRLPEKPAAVAADDAAACGWFPLHHLPQLAFDHGLILQHARERLAELA